MPRRYLAPTADVARHVGRPASTIRNWAQRKLLTRYGTPKRALYDIEEVEQLAARLAREALDTHPHQDGH